MRILPKLLATVAVAAMLASSAPSQAISAWGSRTTTLTGSFEVDGTIRTVRAESRTRAVVAAAFPNVDPYGIGLNPNETTFTVLICNAQGCDLPANRICSSALAEITDTGSEIAVVSTKQGCEVELTAAVESASLPRASAGRVESVAAAQFTAARIQGADAEGADGRVVRAVTWAVTA